jgi:hypothetical protein
MSAPAEIIFLFGVDDTLIDYDRFQDDLRKRLQLARGDQACARYWEIFEELCSALGYADYLGALERLRLEDRHNPALFQTGNCLIEYPFADRLYPHALNVVKHVQQWGRAVVLSDGDAIFQPRKIASTLRSMGRFPRQCADLHP